MTIASRLWRRIVAATAATIALGLGGSASAQEFPIGADATIASGVEGGGKGYAAGVRRARTLFRFGGEMAFFDEPAPRLGAGILVEIEPRSSFGADLRYIHLVTNRFALHIGAAAILAPANLFGATAGAEYRLPLGRRFALIAGPSLGAYFLGSDLPDGTIIWQGLFHVGVHVSLH